MKECEMKIPTSHSKTKKAYESERRENSAKVPIKRKEEKKISIHNFTTMMMIIISAHL